MDTNDAENVNDGSTIPEADGMKAYSEMRMLVGVLIGGPIAASYYLVRTLRALGKSNLSVALAIIFPFLIVLLSVGEIFIPAFAVIPDPFWYLIQFAVVVGFTRGYLFVELRQYLAEFKPVYSWANTLLVAIVSMATTLALLFGIYFAALGLQTDLAKETYGKLKHEIYYAPDNIAQHEVDRLAGALITTKFFTDEYKQSIEVSKSGDKYIIAIFFTPKDNDPEVIDYYRELRTEIQKEFPTEKIVIDMVINTPDNKFARLE